MTFQAKKLFVDPKDISALAVFLASDSAVQVLPIDGDAPKAS